ncbi:MAG: asparagine synthase (glutamine-hydrolyzing) [Firmicutes bacterium]|nr:asparagine synthase (glutamine-hydrolyzing) [Bacillota bacterium]
MCGICGQVRKDHRTVSPETLALMASQMIHRGPDDEGFYCEGEAGFGFRRLAVIDLKTGHQPLCNEDGTVWVVFNGEIYNYRELRHDLEAQGHRFQTATDTEVIVHLYEEVGEQTADRLRGMFAFAVWDARHKVFYAARDPFGIKPFYYSLTENALSFASEIKALLASGRRAIPDPEAFLQFLTFQYVPEPRTLFKGVLALPAAHWMRFDGRELTLHRYWAPVFRPHPQSFSTAAEELRARLFASVKRHMQSDVPRGAFLSSGVDSSTIVALLRTLEPVQTFTVGFARAGYDECAEARETAAFLGTDHHERTITQQEYADVLPKLMWQMDQPIADPAAVALYFVAQEAAEHVTVVLSGEGADEIFGGYNIYREPLDLRPARRLPVPLLHTAARMAHLLPEGIRGRNYLIRAATPLSKRFFGNAKIFDEAEKEHIVGPQLREWLHHYESPEQIAARIYGQHPEYDEITQMQAMDLATWLPGDILNNADRMTMAHSLELRVPYLDRDLFDFAATLPTDFRVGEKTTKRILRAAVAPLLPPQASQRRKLGFPVPLRVWFREEQPARQLRELFNQTDGGGFIQRAAALRLLDEHRSGKADRSRALFTISCFLLWYQAYVSGERRFSPEISTSLARRRGVATAADA